jgi:lipid-binding SYLF domain-containing protein
MKRHRITVIACLLAIVGSPAAPSLAQSVQDQTVQTATSVLDEIMQVPTSSIPQALLADAQGLAIIPGVIKGGFVVGVRFGRGVAMVRDEQGAWRPPAFVSLTGGSVGWQAGLQATDVILVFRTAKSVQGLMNGKFTIGADAAAAAGPVGRQASAATDAQLRAEILSYSRSRGLFAGVSLEGSVLQIDQAATQAFYQPTNQVPDAAGNAAPALLPPSAVRLMETVARHTNRTPVAQAAPASPGPCRLGLQRRCWFRPRRICAHNWPPRRNVCRRCWTTIGSGSSRCRPGSTKAQIRPMWNRYARLCPASTPWRRIRNSPRSPHARSFKPCINSSATI